MTPKTQKLPERVQSWPEEDQDELVEYARDIEARRTGGYCATPRGNCRPPTRQLQSLTEAKWQARGMSERNLPNSAVP
jgi:hypothetical protein